MQISAEIKIRKYKASDRAAVRQLVYRTALLGKSAALFFRGEEVIADALSVYFTDYEPGSAFVAESRGQVIGYLIGAKNKAVAESIFNRRIFLPLLIKAVFKGTFLNLNNLKFISACLVDFLKNGIKTPDFSHDYPATFHMNLAEGYRGQGIGTRLTRVYLDYLRSAGVPGVHLATFSDPAAGFFSAQGFQRLYKGKRNYFRRALHRELPLYILGKRLK